ncbi:uncharacterized protein TrAtP1_001015 [Trichoderma atroviride]|uniref:Siderophore biosynthesis enzyme n=1 Tax=Hypocrea atroviridis (strain ATCC 20476 / IMI 206040) TaxID=452589 RepID=G9NMY4_HYPAI|nr:uncharacterized protein TRIATDRAFT_255747 [Trichoderma atroviride IMI 206040]EHK48262.1 hypothetical protein TRIATDRAFT_255747 [Trichoderma atroviride IMI 206040]UKZ59717.1 hypothetical protein TrAtP1_001015 [Trichoderma atroviride]
MAVRSLAATLLLAVSALAKTDLAGCTYTDTVVQPSGLPGYDAYASRIWYVPGTGELCDFLDCGGGRAPPKTDVPGCPLYSGTATYSPSYLDLQTKAVDAAATSSAEASATGETLVIVKATTAKATTAEATTLATSVAVSQSASAAVTTAAPVVSSGSSTATASRGLSTGTPGHNGNGTSSGAHPTSSVPANGAAPNAAGIVGSVLAAGVVAAVALL